MIISYRWISGYLPQPLPVNDLCEILTAIGLEVEAAEPAEVIPGSLAGLLIGQVLTCEKHPNADKLSLTTVTTDGTNALQIVCGAPNVAAGQKVVVATVGTTVHPTHGEPFQIGKAKIRGVASEGMICAEDEIGLGDSHAGIMILPDSAVVGTPAKTYFNIADADTAIHIGLTPNRSDANSHIGVARDVCAYLSHHRGHKHHVAMPQPVLPHGLQPASITVSITDTQACKRYAGISLSNVTVGESPEWLKNSLRTIGVRSINNVVDITNYVLHEYGQPLHAFDQDKLNGGRIITRLAHEGETFTGLDGKVRKLRPTDLMICDGAGPVALGGVFGGADSGITNSTTHVFLESAFFNPLYIRRTSMHHLLRTDAATHFEKGVDINMVIPALIRAATLIAELTGATIASDIVDCYPETIHPQLVNVTYSFINKLTGKAYLPKAVDHLLESLGFEIASSDDTGLELIVPTNKADVKEPADIVEEVLRIDGLNNITASDHISFSFTGGIVSDHKEKAKVANLLCGMGMYEIVTNSITNSKYYEGNEHMVRMINSLSSELDVLRPSMLQSGLEVIAYNYNRKNADLKLFEFGNVYHHTGGKYSQEANLALWVTGNVVAGSWDQPAQKANIYYLKGLVGAVLQYQNINNYSVSYEDDGPVSKVLFKHKQKTLATLWEVPTAQLSNFDIKQTVFYAALQWETILAVKSGIKTGYKEIPKFPVVQRDLALILDKAVSYKMIEDATVQLKIPALQSFRLFDTFESEKIGNDKKSYAINFAFQATDRTLTDEETEQMMKQLMDVYKTKLQAQINS